MRFLAQFLKAFSPYGVQGLPRCISPLPRPDALSSLRNTLVRVAILALTLLENFIAGW